MGIFGISKTDAIETVKKEFIKTENLINNLTDVEAQSFLMLALKFGANFTLLRLSAPDNVYKKINITNARKFIPLTMAIFYTYIKYYYSINGKKSIIEDNKHIDLFLNNYIYLNEEEKAFPVMLAFNSKNENDEEKEYTYYSFISEELHTKMLEIEDFTNSAYLSILKKICLTCLEEINDAVESLMYVDINNHNEAGQDPRVFAQLKIYFEGNNYSMQLISSTVLNFDQLLVLWGTYATMVFCSFNEFNNKDQLKSNLAKFLISYNTSRTNMFEGTHLTLSNSIPNDLTNLIFSGVYFKDDSGTMVLIPDFTSKTNALNISGSVIAFLQYLINNTNSDRDLEFLNKYITMLEFTITNFFEEKDIMADDIPVVPYVTYTRLCEDQGVTPRL